MGNDNKPIYRNLYNSDYYENYTNEKNIPYRDKSWEIGFESIAEHIIKEFNPKTFLDVGCAFGYLVAALRDRGVEAYGIDISEFAISQVREDIKPYCKAWSALDGIPNDFPSNYDLLSTIEVAEHLYPDDGEVFIGNICEFSDRIIFSSSPDEEEEATHFNVQPAEYWVMKFLENGFFNDYTKKPIFISPQCLYFNKTSDIRKIVQSYELAFKKLNDNHNYEINAILEDRSKAQIIMDNQNLELENINNAMNALKEDREKAQYIMDEQLKQINSIKNDIDILREDRKKAQDIMENQNEIIKSMKMKLAEKENQCNIIVNSMFWKFTKPMRYVRAKIRGRK
ncbi:methyltransferase [uncultured Clostridium sp.]|uniref:methyltransferase n=1 Tax=uncultured Clostridium sp. TaxID=59620 RepID=UPI0028E27E26|nr:methyltransferase [uncultured Clostridium sp.]